MEYRLRTSGLVVTPAQLKTLFPGAHFELQPNGVPLDEALLAEYSIDVVYPAPPPLLEANQTAVRNGAVLDASNKWVFGWRIVNSTLFGLNTVLSVGKTTLIQKIDQDVDFIYSTAMGNRASEYALTEADATAFKAANYEGTVPLTIKAWADATGKTAAWACDDILATAAKWRTVQSIIRAERLKHKERARNSGGLEELIACTEEWTAFKSNILTQI